jgi:hypothetical protein
MKKGLLTPGSLLYSFKQLNTVVDHANGGAQFMAGMPTVRLQICDIA